MPSTPPTRIPRLNPPSESGISERLSPPKRKRSIDPISLPDEIPETPWRTNGFDDLGKTSPRSKKLVGQMQGMNLGESTEESLFDEYELHKIEMAKFTAPATKRRRGSEKQPGKKAVNHSSDIDKVSKSAPKHKLLPKPDTNEITTEKGKTPATEYKRLKSPPPEIFEDDEDETKEVIPPKPAGEDELLSDPDELGIAYTKTPAQRDARRQKQLQQIKDYKSRVSREAREQRIRRRRKSETLHTSTEGEAIQNARKAVRFSD
ncbi:hypothetical protein EDC01DRAFT_626373 [Geopyxis carbonaria]|nr:hypothetical protein EDC01DRAFT_626373 [Geopyxis carbonaria]